MGASWTASTSRFKGGKGKAGLMKHKWTWTVKYEPDHFGAPGFTPPQPLRVKKWINVGQLDAIYDSMQEEVGGSKEKGEKKLNLTELGYNKLLGGGLIKSPYIVQIKSYTKSAKKKIEEAGGKIV